MEDNQPQKTPLRRPIRTYQTRPEEKKERISKVMGGMLIVAAFSVDAFEMLLEWLGIGIFGLSTLLSICASISFWIWFKMLEVNFSTRPKKFGTMLTTSILEVIPTLDALGGFIWTIGIAAIVYMTRKEDEGSSVSLPQSVAHIIQQKTTRGKMFDVIK